ncbi:MAG TPA: phage holin family protein [Aestuariivirga sp.]|nr:phage holin family protein [Aestuariivirga sp.]
MDMPMPKGGAEPLHYPSSKPAFPELFKELSSDGMRWLDAELALAKAEAGLRLRGYATGLGMAFASLCILVAAMVVLAQACVVGLMPYVSGPAVAGLIVGVILLIIVVALALLAKGLLINKTRPIGLVFRWLAGNGPESSLK